MIVRKLEDIIEESSVEADNWTSRRLLLARDGMGFSMHDTVLKAGTTTQMWYRNHVEAVYCVDGQGKLLDLGSGEVHTIRPGTLYALDAHDRHTLHAESDLRVICVFNPPLVGPETHDEHGAYPLLQPEGIEARA